MKRLLTTLLLTVAAMTAATAQEPTELTTAQAKQLYKSTTKKRVSIHDPSVVYNPQNSRYYIFGSHKAGAWTTDMQNWTQANPTWRTATKNSATNKEAFVTPAVTTVPKGGEQVAFPAFNAMEWSARTDASYNIDGNMWAPDVIWNPTMQKWCMYLSINGDKWYSSIVLLTADNITGPYLYQGPVVICGFRDATHTYKDTDLELVIGTQASLPTRYARTSTTGGQTWGDRWPHTIDPTVFYDESGQLWMVYGSWSGGIWMLKLNPENGLRDYDATYPSTNGSANTVTSDPYFGKKVAGGLYVSGEGPYIEHIGDYYYLFVSYGGFAPDGGYEMRVFRSKNPDGPYTDAQGRSAIFTTWIQNYGLGADTRGEKIMGSYDQWGLMTLGECAQGHNSIIAADDGRTYLVYHTKFNDGTVGHQVRVHQVFQTKNGWLVAAPFEYNGETVTDADLAKQTQVPDEQVPGVYQILIHKYKMDYAALEVVTPVKITLTADGKVTGAYTGTWKQEAGTSYLTIRLGSDTYQGVILEEQMDQQSIKTIAFTAMANSGECVWGYRMRDEFALAWQVNTYKLPLAGVTNISRNYDLYATDLADNVSISWSSSHPDIFSDAGRYNPAGLTEPVSMTVSARLTSGDYFWTQDYSVKAQAESYPTGDWQTGLVGHYGFDREPLVNSYDATQQAQLKRTVTATALPTLETDDIRNGHFVHTYAAANKRESYVELPNPLYGHSLENGATLSFWVKCNETDLWDALFSFYNPATQARLYMTGNAYIGFNDNAGNWLDINKPDAAVTGYLPVARWHLVTIVFSRTASKGITYYIDNKNQTVNKFNGHLTDGDKSVTTKAGFSYDRILNHIAASPTFYLGNGSFWGSANACFDDLLFYEGERTASDVLAIFTMQNRVYDFATGTVGISGVTQRPAAPTGTYYDLQGRRIAVPTKGLYIQNGKKIIIR